MRPINLLPLTAAVLLAACGGDAEEATDAEGLTDAELTAASQDVVMARPGQYTATSEMIELDIPGVSDEMVAMMRNQMQQGAMTETSFCLTEEEAARGREEMLKGLSESNCNVTRFDASGGSIDALMQCDDPQGMNGTVAVNGTIGEDSSDIVMEFDQQVPGMDAAHIKMRVKSQRTGECS